MPGCSSLPTTYDAHDSVALPYCTINLRNGCYQCGTQFQTPEYYWAKETENPWLLHVICVHCHENLLDTRE